MIPTNNAVPMAPATVRKSTLFHAPSAAAEYFISPRHEGHQQTACGGTAQHVQNHCYPNTRVHMDEIHTDVAQDQ